MHKTSLIAFLLFFSFLAQSQALSFGKNCTNPILDIKLHEDDKNPPPSYPHFQPFPKLRCWGGFCNEDWEGYGISGHDDILKDKGWTPKQVSLVIHTLNIDNKFNNVNDEKREEDLYKKILDELEETSPFSNVTDFWSFIQSLSLQIQTKINIQTQTALKERLQKICQPQEEPVENPPQPDQEETPPQCCQYNTQSPPTICPDPINEDKERRAWPIEVEIDMCNPAVCCEKNTTDEKTPRYDDTKQDCKANERKATLKEDEEEKCNIGNPTACCSEDNTIVYQEDNCNFELRPATYAEINSNSCTPSEPEEEAETEAESHCSSGNCSHGDSSSPTPPTTADQAEKITQQLEELQEELEETKRKHREEIESLEDQREERDREYGEKREERDKDNTALAADLSDCQSRSGNWSELSEANQKNLWSSCPHSPKTR